jgi:hypothetical protein
MWMDLSNVPFSFEPAPLCDFPTSDIGFVATQTESMGVKIRKTKVERCVDCLGHKPFPLVAAIDKIADLEFGQRPIENTNIDLGNKIV